VFDEHELWAYPDEGGAEPEFHVVKRKGTLGLIHELGRTIASSDGFDEACLLLFEGQHSALEQLHFMGLDPEDWECTSSWEFGGTASLLKIASKLPAPTPTDVYIGGPMVYAPFTWATMETAMRCFESSSVWAQQWCSGRPQRSFWLLRDRGGWIAPATHGDVVVIPITGVNAVCLFKTEMDADEFRHSGWVSPDEWTPDGPVGSVNCAHYLKELSSYQGLSCAVINPPPGRIDPLEVTPIEVVIEHVVEKGHIRDLD
jgi:hypothetical protein